MALVALICPHCGGTVQLDEEMKSGFCVHCGTKIMNDRYISGQVSIDRNVDIINHLKIAKEAASQHDWETLTKLMEGILLMDADCSDAWYLKALSSMSKNIERFDSFVSKGDNGNKYDIFSKEDVFESWGECTITVDVKELKLLRSPSVIITLDNGKESLEISKNQTGKIGVSAGLHNLTVASVDKNLVGSALYQKEEAFMINDDITVEVDFPVRLFKIIPSFEIRIPKEKRKKH